MSTSVARLKIPQHQADGSQLGPATVTEIRGSTVVVQLRGGAVVPAQMALAFPYAPAVNDVLLVIGQDGEHYVIGVLSAAGRTSLSFQGDVDLQTDGTLNIAAQQGLRLRSPEVTLEADKLQMTARRLKQSFDQIYQRARSLLSVHAGRTQTVVDDSAVTKAKNATSLTEQTMVNNGEAIHLG